MSDTLRLQVARVKDGDTLVCQAQNGDTVDVRVWGVDCPETSQPYGPAATDVAREIVGGDVVEVDVMDSDHYGRIIGRVRNGTTDLGRTLARNGVAWHSRRYGTSSRLKELEQDARSEGRGLWTQDDPTPPWVYRNGSRTDWGSAFVQTFATLVLPVVSVIVMALGSVFAGALVLALAFVLIYVLD